MKRWLAVFSLLSWYVRVDRLSWQLKRAPISNKYVPPTSAIVAAPPRPKLQLRPALPSTSETSHFRFSTELQLSELAKELIPENTKVALTGGFWKAQHVAKIKEWCKSRKSCSRGHFYILRPRPFELSSLSVCCGYSQNTNGEQYPPSSLHQLLLWSTSTRVGESILSKLSK